MSVPLIALLVWVLAMPTLAVWRWWVVRARDRERWLIEVESERLTVRPQGPLTRAQAGDWDALAALARDLGVRDVVLAVSEPDPNAGWALHRAQERLGCVASVTLQA